jgi:hypothetical protein
MTVFVRRVCHTGESLYTLMNIVTMPAEPARRAARRWPSRQSPAVIEEHGHAGEEAAGVADRIDKVLATGGVERRVHGAGAHGSAYFSQILSR